MKKTESMRDINPFGLRLPADLRHSIEVAAGNNHRSLNAEIVARLTESFLPSQGASAAQADIEALLDDLAAEYQNASLRWTDICLDMEETAELGRNAHESKSLTVLELRKKFRALAGEKAKLELQMRQLEARVASLQNALQNIRS